MKKIWLAILTMALLLLTACSPQAAIYHNDEAIAAESDAYSLTKWTTTSDKLTLSGGGTIVGTLTLWSMDAAQETSVNIDTALTVEAGRAKLVYISPSGTVETLLERTPDAPGMDSVLTFTALPGTGRVKIVAENNTKLTLNLTFSDGELT